MTSLVGQTIGGYRVEAELGRGGQAVVYRATQLSLQRPVALKVVHPQGGLDPGFLERFRREGISAAQLDHPHVVPVYEAGEAGGIAFLAMKLIDGPTLDGLVRREGRLAPRRAVAILRQVAEALDYAAARGLVHRDVKPANVLVGPGDHAYLSDFGLTKALEGGEALTRTGTWMGTLEYISPEQVTGAPVTPAADRYSLAVIAYELLCGRSPFPREDRTAVMYAHVHDSPPPPSQVDPGIGPGFDAAVLAGLAKDPAGRPGSAVELIDALGAAAAAAPTRPDPSPATAPGGAADTVAGEVPPPPQDHVAPPPLEPGAPPDVRRRRRLLIFGGAGASAVAGVIVAVVAAAGGGGGDTPVTVTVQPTDTQATTEAFPSAREAQLIGRAPEVIRSTCDRTPQTAQATGAVASIRCEIGDQGVYYEEFADATAITGYYDGLLVSRGVTRGSGECPGKAVGESSYGQGDRKPNVGRVVCYRLDDGSPAVVWTHTRLRILSTMIGGDDATPARLLAAWRDAGPYE